MITQYNRCPKCREYSKVEFSCIQEKFDVQKYGHLMQYNTGNNYYDDTSNYIPMSLMAKEHMCPDAELVKIRSHLLCELNSCRWLCIECEDGKDPNDVFRECIRVNLEKENAKNE